MNILEEFEKKYVVKCSDGDILDGMVDAKEVLNFIRSKFNQLLDEIPVEERGTKNYTNSYDAIINSDKDYGYNQHCKEIKEFIKSKKL